MDQIIKTLNIHIDPSQWDERVDRGQLISKVAAKITRIRQKLLQQGLIIKLDDKTYSIVPEMIPGERYTNNTSSTREGTEEEEELEAVAKTALEGFEGPTVEYTRNMTRQQQELAVKHFLEYIRDPEALNTALEGIFYKHPHSFPKSPLFCALENPKFRAVYYRTP